MEGREIHSWDLQDVSSFRVTNQWFSPPLQPPPSYCSTSIPYLRLEAEAITAL